ncbi:MAG TPA: transaldolase, partial [Syntrophales bacterium]|nr:transaldolase [Syntrophales bacterium]
MTKLQEVAKLGQSIWLDNIHRTLIVSGELQSLIDEGLRGVTSNPTIFEKAISGSTAYDGEVERLAGEGKSAKEIYESLAMEDIAMAADLLRPVYDAAHGDDGFVSLEVSPDLAHDTEGTVAEARRLFSALNRPNVMIKVPATEAGLPAVERLTAEGINVNVTLIFSLRQYEEVAEAYIRGLERRAEEGKDLREIASVASVFVSRVDTMVDPLLEKA